MPRMKILGAMLLASAVSAMSAASVRAAAPALPPDAIGSDSIVVVRVDSAHFNPDQLQAAATAVLGQNANKADEQLKKFKEKFDKAAAAGAEAMIVVVDGKKGGAATPPPATPDGAPVAEEENNSVAYVQLKAGADPKAIETLMLEDMKPEEKDKTLFDQADNFLAIHRKGQTFPVKPDAARQQLFADALGTISDASIQVAFVPNDATRAEMTKVPEGAPKSVKDMTPILAKAKWMTVAAVLGNAPSLTVTADAANADDAKSLSDAVTAGVADAKAMINDPNGGAGPLALFGQLINQVLDAVKPATSGTQVSVTLKTETLKLIGTGIGNLPIFGAPGAAPGGPPGRGL